MADDKQRDFEKMDEDKQKHFAKVVNLISAVPFGGLLLYLLYTCQGQIVLLITVVLIVLGIILWWFTAGNKHWNADSERWEQSEHKSSHELVATLKT